MTLIALLTLVFEVLGLLLCAVKTEGAPDMQAVMLCAAVAPLGLLTTLALPRFLPMDSLVMALTNFLCGVGVVVLYTVSPARGARQAVFYALGLAVMLVMSEIVFHVHHFRGLTLLGMVLGIGALILPLAFGEWNNGREKLGAGAAARLVSAQRNRKAFGRAGAGVLFSARTARFGR